MGKAIYVLQHDDHTFCKYCGKEVELLCERTGRKTNNWFYICWPCKKVFQLGLGEVQEVKT
jgi:hypothetical protein